MVVSREQMKAVVDKFEDIRPFLTERKYEIVTMWLNGKSYEDIAKTFNVTTNHIKQTINGYGVFGKGGIYKRLIYQAKEIAKINSLRKLLS